MKINSALKPKHVAWALGALVAVILFIAVAHSGAKASVQPPSSRVVEIAKQDKAMANKAE
jgi:hypothetical protein